MAKRAYRPVESVHCHRPAAAKALDALTDKFPDRNKADLVEAALRYCAEHAEDIRQTIEAVVPPSPTGGKRTKPRTGDLLVKIDLVHKDQVMATLIGSEIYAPRGQFTSQDVVIEAAMRFGLYAFREMPDIARRMIRWEQGRRHRFVHGPRAKAQRNCKNRLSVALGMTERTRSKGFEVSLDELPESYLQDSPDRHLR